MKDHEQMNQAFKLVLGLEISDIAKLVANFHAQNGRMPEKIYVPGGIEVSGVKVGVMPELKEPVAL